MFIIPISQSGSIFSQTAPVQQGDIKNNLKMPFADILTDSMQQLAEAQKVSQQDAYDLAMGRADDLHTISIHSAQATAALEVTVQIASRAVNAYKEILQMQV